MNREEIKKTLGCWPYDCSCSECKYNGKPECSSKTIAGALELIKEQEAEIVILKDDLKDENSDLVAEYRKKVIEEFADKLKERFHNYYPSVTTYCVSTKAISYDDLNKALREFK